MTWTLLSFFVLEYLLHPNKLSSPLSHGGQVIEGQTFRYLNFGEKYVPIIVSFEVAG